MDLVLQIKDQSDKTLVLSTGSETVMITPPVGAGYWKFRVQVSRNQAIIGFPKFFQIGIGYEVEEDWNTNLPSTKEAEVILEHIWHNRGKGNGGKDFRKRCLKAIQMIQEAQNP